MAREGVDITCRPGCHTVYISDPDPRTALCDRYRTDSAIRCTQPSAIICDHVWLFNAVRKALQDHERNSN